MSSLLQYRYSKIIFFVALLLGWVFYLSSLDRESKTPPEYYEIKRANSSDKVTRGAVGPKVNGQNGQFYISAHWANLNSWFTHKLQIRVDDCLQKLAIGQTEYKGFEVPYCDYNHAHYISIPKSATANGELAIQGILENKGGAGGIEFALTRSSSMLLIFNLISFALVCAILVILKGLLRKPPQAPSN